MRLFHASKKTGTCLKIPKNYKQYSKNVSESMGL